MDKKNIASLVVKGITVVFLMFATAIASFAWFTNNQNVKNKDIQMGIHSEDASATFSIYKYDLEANGIIEDICTSDQDTVSPITLDFNQYDTVFVDRNKYTPIVIKAEVESVNLHLSAGETGTVSFIIIRSVSSRTAGLFYTSDILRFTTVFARDVSTSNPSEYTKLLYEGFLEDYYEKTKTQTVVNNNNLTSQSFIFSTNPNDESYNDLVISISYDNDDLNVIPSDNPNEDDSYSLVVYLFISYDESLINTVIENQGVGGFGSQELDFHNDLTLLNVKNDKTSGGGN